MTRRDILKGIGAAAMIPLVASATSTLPGWNVVWSGWIDVPNQMLKVGHWRAWRDGDESCVVSVAPYGRVQVARELEALDMRLDSTQRQMLPMRDDRYYEPAKQAAWDALCQHITTQGVA